MNVVINKDYEAELASDIAQCKNKIKREAMEYTGHNYRVGA